MAVPTLSVLMGVRNVERWLPATLGSLRTQTRTDFEVVAVDDGSTDGTTEILRNATDLPLTIIRTQGVGIGAARNLAIGAASAPLLSVLDGDDMWLPNYMEQVVGLFEVNPDIAIVSPELLLAVEGEITATRYYADGHPLRWFDDDQLVHLAEMNFIAPLSAFRREVVETVGVYDPTPGALEDWDLWIRALQAGFRAGHIPEPCGVYRFRAGSITNDRIDLIMGRIHILERLAATEGPATEQAQAALSFQQLQLLIAQGKEALRTGEHSIARTAFADASRHRDASIRQRTGALIAAAFPRLAQTVLSRRSPARAKNRLAMEARQARE
jgi:glycosyltransferase involved in cell wall biosynthesis